MTIETRSGTSIARDATVRVCDQKGNHKGQGLLLTLDDGNTIVLTCYHVVANLDRKSLHIAMRQSSGQPGDPVPAAYDAEHSKPDHDVAVLRIDGITQSERPVLYSVDPDHYSGSIPEYAKAFGYWGTGKFEGRLGIATEIPPIDVSVRGPWPNAPHTYRPSHVFPLMDVTNAQEGVSGSTVMFCGGVIGLVNFTRQGAPGAKDEGYIVPLTVWAESWPELQRLIKPLIDPRLLGRAIVKPPNELEVGNDILLVKMDQDVHGAGIYIERPVDQIAHTEIKKRETVFVVGRPLSGKSRLVLELLRKFEVDLVVIPERGAATPDSFEPIGLTGRRIAILFDNIHEQSLTADPMQWKRRIEGANPESCYLICTSRDGIDWDDVQHKYQYLIGSIGISSILYTSKVNGQGDDFPVDLAQQLAKELRIPDSDFEHRFDGTPGSLTLDLHAMRLRYKRLFDEAYGGISKSRFIDSVKILASVEGLSLRCDYIRSIAEQIRGRQAIDDEVWQRLLKITEDHGFGTIDMEHNEFHIYRPYLEQCVQFTPTEKQIRDLDHIFTKAGDRFASVNLAYTLATKLGNVAAAEDLLAQTANTGGSAEVNAYAYYVTGLILENIPGRTAAAESAYRLAIDGDYPDALINLANLLSRQEGRHAEAKELLRLAMESGHPFAINNLATLLSKQDGQQQETEKLFRQAISEGHVGALFNLATFIDHIEGRHEEAKQLYRRAIDAGFRPAYHNLAVLLNKMGQPHEAEELYLRAIDDGSVDSLVNLASLLSKQESRQGDAEMYYRRAIDAGDSEAMRLLADMLSKQGGRLAEAEALYLEAIDSGDLTSLNNLAILLFTQEGRQFEAKKLLRQAIVAGDVNAANNLALILSKQQGYLDEAETLFRQAIDGGHTRAVVNLARMLGKQEGRQEEAETLYHLAIGTGDTQARKELDELVKKHQ